VRPELRKWWMPGRDILHRERWSPYRKKSFMQYWIPVALQQKASKHMPSVTGTKYVRNALRIGSHTSESLNQGPRLGV
jgi:hypothetical protein